MSEHDLPRDIAELLERARSVPRYPLSTRERVWRAVRDRLPPGGSGPQGGDPPPEGPAPVASGPASGVTGAAAANALRAWMARLGFFLAGTAAGAWGHAHWGAPEQPTVAVVAAVEAAPEPEAPVPLVDVDAGLATGEAQVVPGPARARSESAGTLRDERRILDAARSAIAHHHPESALPLLERYVQRFPRGQLREERDALWVQALALSGAHEEAVRAARSFERDHPRSLFVPAVRAAVRSEQSGR